jgi:hypothetical protein
MTGCFEWRDITNCRQQVKLCTGRFGCRVEQRTEIAFWNILTVFEKEF